MCVVWDFVSTPRAQDRAMGVSIRKPFLSATQYLPGAWGYPHPAFAQPLIPPSHSPSSHLRTAPHPTFAQPLIPQGTIKTYSNYYCLFPWDYQGHLAHMNFYGPNDLTPPHLSISRLALIGTLHSSSIDHVRFFPVV